jgi:NADPH:quinone reductase-like Zn-dependent oxidoreductase
LKPEFLTWEEAGSISLTALTAWQALVEEPKSTLTTGMNVFVNGGSGGVGLFSIQMARYLVGKQGKVVTTCSSKNVPFVKEYGVDDAIDYTSIKDLPKYLREQYSSDKFDVIVDCIGDFAIYNGCPGYLNPRGDYIVIGAPIPKGVGGLIGMLGKIGAAVLWPGFLGGVPRRFVMSVMQATEEKMTKVGELVERKEVRTVVDSVWGFDDEGVKGAYRKIMTGHARGKVVIKITE